MFSTCQERKCRFDQKNNSCGTFGGNTDKHTIRVLRVAFYTFEPIKSNWHIDLVQYTGSDKVPSSSGLGHLVLIQKIAGSTPAGITLREFSLSSGYIARAPAPARSDAKGFFISPVSCLSFKMKFEPMFLAKVRRLKHILQLLNKNGSSNNLTNLK